MSTSAGQNISPIERAVMVVGSQTKLAEMIGVTQGTVSQWILGIRPVPATRCRAIEAAAQRKVTCEQLRPDVFGPPANVA